MSPGLSNSYLLATDEGRVMINTGMGFEGPLHQRAYAGIVRTVRARDHPHPGPLRPRRRGRRAPRGRRPRSSPRPTSTSWRADNERLEAFRARNAAFAWMDAIVAAMAYAESLGVGADRAGPARTHDDLRRPARAHRSGAAGSSCSRCRVARRPTRWSSGFPSHARRSPGTSFGPLFGHVPNLVTIRGDRYRDALPTSRRSSGCWRWTPSV